MRILIKELHLTQRSIQNISTGMIMNYTVEYVELENGEKPFEKFVLSLPSNERAKVFGTINYFKELKN